MNNIMPRLRSHFDPLQSRFECFCQYGVQLEGWFKGELLTVLDQMKREGVLTDFDREVKVDGKRVDIKISIDGLTHWIELKFWLLGRQRGTKYGPSFYFGDSTSVGISKDVAALQNLSEEGKRWLLILTAARPESGDWLQGIEKHNTKFSHYLLPHTQPADFPSAYFLGLLEVVAA